MKIILNAEGVALFQDAELDTAAGIVTGSGWSYAVPEDIDLMEVELDDPPPGLFIGGAWRWAEGSWHLHDQSLIDAATPQPPPLAARTRLWFWDALALALAEPGAPPDEDARDALWTHPALFRVIKRAEIGDVVDPIDVFARQTELIGAGIVSAEAFQRLALLWAEG